MVRLPKALSIRQPWAWAIVHAGNDIGNRDWRSDYRGPVLIHASKSTNAQISDAMIDRILESAVARGTIPPPAEDLGYGGIIGVAEIVDCVDGSDSPWFFGRYGFVLANARPLTFTPCRGSLGFFEPELSSAERDRLIEEIAA